MGEGGKGGAEELMAWLMVRGRWCAFDVGHLMLGAWKRCGERWLDEGKGERLYLGKDRRPLVYLAMIWMEAFARATMEGKAVAAAAARYLNVQLIDAGSVLQNTISSTF